MARARCVLLAHLSRNCALTTFGQTSNHVVATKLSNTNPRDVRPSSPFLPPRADLQIPRQLIVSYSGDNVYLFDTDAEPASPPSPVSTPPKAKRGNSSPAESSAVVKRRKEEESTPAAASSSEAHEGPASEGEHGESGDDSGEGSGAEGGRPSVFGPRHPRIYDPAVPVVYPRRTYAGHRNVDTVKDVNFAFWDSHVVSGSDDGHFFAWEKESAKLVGIFEGDSSGAFPLSLYTRGD